MLYDETFRASVLDGRAPVDAADRAMLRAVDARAWTTDPYRVARTLGAILTELPITGALLGTARARAFFGSPAFHDAIEGRGSLVLAFAGWARVGPVGELEGAIAILRRTQHPEPTPGSMALGPFRPIAVPRGTLGAYESLRAALGSEPVAAIGTEPRAAPALADDAEHLLVERATDGSIGIGAIGSSLYDVLAPLLAGPRTSAQLAAHLRTLGAGRDADAILASLLADGVIVTAP
jgi:hypothetical protein